MLKYRTAVRIRENQGCKVPGIKAITLTPFYITLDNVKSLKTVYSVFFSSPLPPSLGLLLPISLVMGIEYNLSFNMANLGSESETHVGSQEAL